MVRSPWPGRPPRPARRMAPRSVVARVISTGSYAARPGMRRRQSRRERCGCRQSGSRLTSHKVACPQGSRLHASLLVDACLGESARYPAAMLRGWFWPIFAVIVLLGAEFGVPWLVNSFSASGTSFPAPIADQAVYDPAGALSPETEAALE